MLQTLLADRFHVTLHRQTKERQAMMLTVGKNGPKFHESKADGDTSLQPKTVGKIRGHIELAAANVNLAFIRLAKWHDAGVEAMHQRTQR